MLFTIPVDPTIWKYALMLHNQCAIFSGFPSYISGGSIFIVGQGRRGGSLNTSCISPIAVATPVAASLCCSAMNADQIALIVADENVPTSAVNNRVQAAINVSIGVKGISSLLHRDKGSIWVLFVWSTFIFSPWIVGVRLKPNESCSYQACNTKVYCKLSPVSLTLESRYNIW